VESLIRNIRLRIGRYMTHRGTQKWTNILQALETTLNSTIHSSHGHIPKEVGKMNEGHVFRALYKRFQTPKKLEIPAFKLNDFVRISIYKVLFVKEYEESWSREIFKIRKVFKNYRPIVNALEDMNGEHLVGNFYKEELLRVTK